jgi:hypothetical protein
MTRPTQAQVLARNRNWRIRNLRSLHAMARQLTGSRREVAQIAIDEELTLLGAEATAAREERFLKEMN